MSAAFAIAQLRHLYKQMLDGEVRDTAQAARGLLGPSIVKLEHSAAKEELKDHDVALGALVVRLADARKRLLAGVRP